MAHQYPVAVYDGVEPVSDGEHGAFTELVPYRFLDQLIRPADGTDKNELSIETN